MTSNNPKANLALVRALCRARGFTLRRSLGRYYVWDRRSKRYLEKWSASSGKWQAFRSYTLQAVYDFVVEFPTEQFHP